MSAKAPRCCIDWMRIASPHYDNPTYRAVSLLQAYGQMVGTGVTWARRNIEPLLPRFSKKKRNMNGLHWSRTWTKWWWMPNACLVQIWNAFFILPQLPNRKRFCDGKAKEVLLYHWGLLPLEDLTTQWFIWCVTTVIGVMRLPRFSVAQNAGVIVGDCSAYTVHRTDDGHYQNASRSHLNNRSYGHTVPLQWFHPRPSLFNIMLHYVQ